MKFDLTKAKFIPQSNVKSKEASLEHLVSVKIKEEIKYDLVYNKAKKNWKIDKEFIHNQTDGEGWTASFQDGYVFLVKTHLGQPDELQPKFLKGACQSLFTSDYFTLIVGEVFDLDKEEGFFLNEEEYVGDIKVYSISSVKTILEEHSNHFPEDFVPTLEYVAEYSKTEEVDSFTKEQDEDFNGQVSSFAISQVEVENPLFFVTGEGVATDDELY